MKKLTGLITALFIGLASLNAMSYEEARDRARYLTDKMAYELNLNDQQYNDAYEINLDYLMNIRTESDATGAYLEYRNTDLCLILHDWQFALFRAAEYFFWPVAWRAGAWYLPIYGIYGADKFFYNPPQVYHAYRGGHWAFHRNQRTSFYAQRRPAWNGGMRGESKNPVQRTGRTLISGWGQGTGFHFEPVTRSQWTAGADKQETKSNNGFHFEPVTSSGSAPRSNSSTKTQATQRTGSTTVKRQQTSENNRTEGYVKNQRSNYNHPSSTRTTVKQATRQPDNRKSTQTTPAVSGKTQVQKKDVTPRQTRQATGTRNTKSRTEKDKL